MLQAAVGVFGLKHMHVTDRLSLKDLKIVPIGLNFTYFGKKKQQFHL